MSDPASIRTPPVYALLTGQPNLAADAALIEALPDLEPELQEVALDTLIARARDGGLAELVGRFSEFDEHVRESIVARINGLYAGVRLAIADERVAFQVSAVELIRRSGQCKLTYLLVDALRSRSVDRQARELAAAALNEVTADYVARRAWGAADTDEATALDRDGAYLARALRRAIECWELHFRGEVLLAAVWLGDRLEEVLLAKATAARSRFARALIETIYGGYNPQDGRLASFALRALKSPQLRTEMGKRLASCRHPDFVQALIDESWLLADPRIARAFQRVHQLAWLDPVEEWLLEMPADRAEGALRLIAAAGLKAEEKTAAYAELLSAGGPAIQEAAFWRLVEIEADAATDVLRALARRGDGRLAAVAGRELEHRGGGEDERATADDSAGESSADGESRAFSNFWLTFDELDDEAQRKAGAALANGTDGLPAHLGRRLASAEPRDRARALRMARVLEMGAALAEQVYRAANDADAVVRSSAAALLGDIGGATTRRILRRLLDDPDPRVQANAIEAIDRMEVPQRDEQFLPKLEAPHHRVRATAVAALLRMQVQQAGEVLLDMLEDRSRAHRIAALWVVERLQLGSLLYRLEHLAQHDPDKQVQRRARRVSRAIGSWLLSPEAAPVEGELL
ncbi:MAG TPA: HEAT repeat domain-containing protein [Phycisphaerae bacterium]|nr:HEAT repeat domain-containing protein [Phycisphaerae bacterium]